MQVLKTVLQIAFLFALSWVGNQLSAWLHLPIPGSILALFILFALLQFGLVHLKWLEQGANWLLAELLLFFLPSAVGIVQYKQLMLQEGAQVMLAIALSTITVMVLTGVCAEFLNGARGRIKL